MCNKTIVEKSWLGKVQWKCPKPEYKDGLCKGHYDRKIRKATPYGQREGYREPTLEEMKSSKTLYLKTMGSYGGHRMMKGVITIGDKHSVTTIKPLPELFVIKI
jgi:hypothetical protein